MATAVDYFDNVLNSGLAFVITEDIDLASVAAASSDVQTFTTDTTGFIKSGDFMVLLDDPIDDDLTVVGGVAASADDEIAVKICNPSAGAIDRASGAYTFLVFKVAGMHDES